MNIILQR